MERTAREQIYFPEVSRTAPWIRPWEHCGRSMCTNFSDGKILSLSADNDKRVRTDKG